MSISIVHGKIESHEDTACGECGWPLDEGDRCLWIMASDTSRHGFQRATDGDVVAVACCKGHAKTLREAEASS